jgi:ABC-type nitrate/sulfonate/bicarbonate transport system substrate-binding protein
VLKVIWFVPPVVHLVADRRGLLAASQVAVEGRLTGSSDEQFAALRDGGCDAVVTAMDNVVMWNRREGGGGFRIVGQVEKTTAISLMARPEIDAISSLQGRRLLVDSAQNGFVVALRMLLADHGVDFDGGEVLQAGGVKERFAALLEANGDATLLGPPFSGMAEARGMRRLADVDAAYPGFPGQGIVVRSDLPGDRRDEVVRWLAALDQARAECRRHPGEAAAALAASGLGPAVAAALVGAVGETLTPDRAGVEMIVAHRRRLGLPGGDDAYEVLVDLAILAEAGRRAPVGAEAGAAQ